MIESMRRMYTEKEIQGFVLKRIVHHVTDAEEAKGFVTIQRLEEDGKKYIPSLFVVVNYYGRGAHVTTILSVVAGQAEANLTHINSYSLGGMEYGSIDDMRSEITVDFAQVISGGQTIEVIFLDTDAPTKAIDY